MWHFSDNNSCPEGDRLHKIQPLIDLVLQKYQSIYNSGKIFCIDETIVPFQS